MLGVGRAGRAAIGALSARVGTADVRAWDDSRSDRARATRRSLSAAGIAFVADEATALDHVRTVVKSPGVDLDHPLILAAEARGMAVIDELELGWRLSRSAAVAITGTNGKSTTASLIASVLDAAGADPRLCGNTLGGPPLCEVSPAHAGWVVIEASSYQLEACPALVPDAAVFTNLTSDHLHRHGSMAAYAEAKRRLFVRGESAVALAVLNLDDELGGRLASEVGERGGDVLTYGWSEGATYRLREASGLGTGTRIVLETPSGVARLDTRLEGSHNAENVAAALAFADGVGVARPAALEALARATAPPGRFERVDVGAPYDVIVDFAHTPDSVERTITAARESVARRDGRLVVVLGVIVRGDPAVRRRTGAVARAGADHLVLCGSSLKGEPPLVGLAGLLAGARTARGGELDVVLGRRDAIARGLALAGPGDLVLLLGRGPLVAMAHDRIGDPQPFDDRDVARELAAVELRGSVDPA